MVAVTLLLAAAPSASAGLPLVDPGPTIDRIGVGGVACVQIWPPDAWLSSCGIPCLVGLCLFEAEA